MAERTTATGGLRGCIRVLGINNRVYDLRDGAGDVLYGSAVGECGNDPCEPNPCHHGGICHAKEAEMFHCQCRDAYTGTGMGAVGSPPPWDPTIFGIVVEGEATSGEVDKFRVEYGDKGQDLGVLVPQIMSPSGAVK